MPYTKRVALFGIDINPRTGVSFGAGLSASPMQQGLCAMRILLVEDNEELAMELRKSLVGLGHLTSWASTIEEARKELASTQFEAAILDLGLPDGDGYELVREVRAAKSDLPLLILTARSTVQDRVTGLKSGADDYLTKPFAMEELVARLEVIVRRLNPPSEIILSLNNVQFNATHRQLLVDSRTVSLPVREMDLLESLLRRKGRVVPKEAIEERLFEEGRELGSNAIEVYVHRLRKHLAECGAQIEIHTIRGVGYCLKEQE